MARLLGEPLYSVFWFRRGRTALSLATVKSILVVRLDELGDVVLFTPFLRELRRNAPQAWIGLVVKPAVRNLVELCPYVNQVFTFDLESDNGRWPPLTRHWRTLKFGWRHCWSRRLDLAISPRRTADAKRGIFLMYFSGANWRAAYTWSNSINEQGRPQGEDALLTHPFQCRAGHHEVEDNLQFLRLLGGDVKSPALELWITNDEKRFGDTEILALGENNRRPVIAIGPGAFAPERIWPLENFLSVAQFSVQELGSRIVIIGGADDKIRGETIARQVGSRCLNLAGQTTFRQTAALLSKCSVFVGNDSGPMHIAAAMSVPVVEISSYPRGGWFDHPRSPARFGPWQVPKIILQPEQSLAPCQGFCAATFPHCITQVSVEQVRQAICQLLVSTGSCPAPTCS